MITIKETTYDDIKNIQSLWADADVMKYIWPGGLQETLEGVKEWVDREILRRPMGNHYSIYEDGKYCGETAYSIDEDTHSASLDIKLFEFARGRGIATKALTHSIEEAFKNGAEILWVDPHPENNKALALYQRLGFVRKKMPEYVIAMGEDPNVYAYMELRKELWKNKFLAVFSGFPEHHFSEEITNRFREELKERKSIVFITACPLDYEQNDDDCDGMHEMFVEQGLAFEKHTVIDKRTDPSVAKELVENADAIFLMGGGVCEEQLGLIREKGCFEALVNGRAAVFGVSAGSMNMARNTVDFFESMEPFDGLGLTNITVSCHHDPEDTWRYEQTLRMSEDRVVYAMTDLSAFFIQNGKIDTVGTIYRVENRELKPLTEEDIKELERDF